ncbi:MAG: hypothetical protein Ct9H300mP6_15750 [Gammaproteobacteria bacterium]|nr:MAG: hypothetical protein Ct9H300mP6_15750 [Gammaproteobacteria bacterium]
MAKKFSNSEFEIIGPPADPFFYRSNKSNAGFGPFKRNSYLNEFKSKLPEFEAPSRGC